jgi:ribosome-binding factor A
VAYRADRLAVIIRDELSSEILRTLEFPGALVTITEVELSQKQDTATVHVSVLPQEKEGKTVAALNKARGALAHALLKRLKIRVVPFLTFKLDRGLANAAAVDKVFIEHPLSEEQNGG